MALAPGTRIGPYEVIALLGTGSMGEGYRATDPRLGRDVAIKVLPDATRASPEPGVRFEREARLLVSISHPNVATIDRPRDDQLSISRRARSVPRQRPRRRTLCPVDGAGHAGVRTARGLRLGPQRSGCWDTRSGPRVGGAALNRRTTPTVEQSRHHLRRADA